MAKKAASNAATLEEPQNARETFHNEVRQCILDYVKETQDVKRYRLMQNRRNWDSYFLRGDFSQKLEGMSMEYLPKNANAAEQVVALINSTLTNFDQWFAVEPVGLYSSALFSEEIVKALMMLYLKKAKIKLVLSDGAKIGVHEGTVTLRRVGELTHTTRFLASGRSLKKITLKEWELSYTALTAEDWFPDAYAMGAKPLFEIQQMSVDYFELLSRTRTSENPEGLYDPDALKDLPAFEDLEIEQRKSRNRGELTYNRRSQRRHPIQLYAFTGTLLDRDGNVLVDPETQIEMRNVVATLANQSVLIQPPEPNPRWDGTSGYVSAPILRTPFAAFSKALADAGERLNVSLNELFNLMLDGGLSAVHGIKQIHSGWLENDGQVSEGIPPGTVLILNDSAPQAVPVMERVDTGNVPADVLEFFNILSGLHTEAMLTNEIRLGQVPKGDPTATSIVQSSQAITGIFDSITKEFEVALVEPLLEGTWHDILQNIDEFPEDDLIRIAGPNTARIIQGMTRQQRFALGFKGFKFVAKGLSSLTERLKDFQRLAQFLSVLGANQPLLQEFLKEYSMPKLLARFMHSLSIDADEVKLAPQEIQQRAQMDQAMQQAQIQAMSQGNAPAAPTNGSRPRAAALPVTPGGGAGQSAQNQGQGAP